MITGRVHPGETPSSWMMKGFMDFLTGDTQQARVSVKSTYQIFETQKFILYSIGFKYYCIVQFENYL